ncbi:M23 family metallopeptidase [Roseiflexus sp.]|uniref:M23 family metallopeptidase n=1 Tax=Roseiflexus sp. TaxID=2562120 RepID=UPI00398A938C
MKRILPPVLLAVLLATLLAAVGQFRTASVALQAPVLPASPLPTDPPRDISLATRPPTATRPPSTATAGSTATPVLPTAMSAPPTATAGSTATPVLPTAMSAPPTATAGSTAILAPPTAPPAPEQTGLRYVFPVQDAACWYPASHHTYPAVDIFCPIGTPFVAVTSGAVDFVSREDLWKPSTNRPEHRGGLAVAIIGDDGVRYYGSHLSEVAVGIEPGVRVEAGQLLGWTGSSGNARGTDPHLHFGISRPTTPDDWAVRRGQVWPQPYLAAWKRGENMTPMLP